MSYRKNELVEVPISHYNASIKLERQIDSIIKDFSIHDENVVVYKMLNYHRNVIVRKPDFVKLTVN